MRTSLSNRATFSMVFALLLSACGSAEGEEVAESEQNKVTAGETWEQYDERRDNYEGSRGSFGGNGCTEDCSGHEAGYEWAQDKGITDPDSCGGNSWSFEEGCRTYAEEQSESEESSVADEA